MVPIALVQRQVNAVLLLALSEDNPVNTRRSPNAGSMLGQRRRRWANIEPALGECLVIAGNKK